MKLISLAIILTLILTIASCVVVYQNYINKDIQFGNFDIKNSQLKDLTEPIGEGAFVICSIKDNECSISIKENIK